MLPKLNWDFWRRVLPRVALLLGVGVTFLWMALLAYGIVALISWVI